MAEILLWHWFAFGGLIVCLLMVDLLVFHRTAHAPSLWESAGWSVVWIAIALVFNAFIWWWRGPKDGLNFLLGYVVEKSLSMDNIFVFIVIFRFFHVPMMYHYRVLFWGILGAVLMRLAFILLGSELLKRFNWVMLLFGLFLLYTALKLAFHSGSEVDPQKNPVLRFARRFLRVSHGDHHQHGDRFFVREKGHMSITPLFLVLLVVESTDVLFAVDSVPAIFGITREPFIIFTSNVFAILGLRALYFLLAGVMDMFAYLHYGLAAVLGFIGVKMIAEYIVVDLWQVRDHLMPDWVSLAVVAALLAISIFASMAVRRRQERARRISSRPSEEPEL